MWLSGEMRILKQDIAGADNGIPTSAKFTTAGALPTDTVTALKPATTTSDVKDSTLLSLDLVKFITDSDKTHYYKILSTEQTINPNDQQDPNHQAEGSLDSSDTADDVDPNSKAYSEVQSVQAGGFLAYAPANAEFSYVLNQPTLVKIIVDTDGNERTVDVA